MNILFSTITYPNDPDHRNIYSDLMEELRDRGHRVYIVAPSERRYGRETHLIEGEGISVLWVKTWNLQKTKNPVEKGLATLLIERQFKRAIELFWGEVHFDLIIYSTPPITFDGLVRHFKTKYAAKSYLLLKDIFPQNAVDLSMMKANGILHRYFKAREKRLYLISDFIGCMSAANKEYIQKHNKFLDSSRIEVCPNSIRPSSEEILTSYPSNEAIRNKYNIPADAVIFVYGGNLGKPQGIGFLEKVLQENDMRRNVFFVIVGSGTEFDRVKRFQESHHFSKMALYPYLPKAEYNALLSACDVGLVFLDPKFSIPNFPSRLLAYMDMGKPILAATDKNTDIGKTIMEGDFGFWCESGDSESFSKYLQTLASDAELRSRMGVNARRYLLEHFTASISADILLKHFE